MLSRLSLLQKLAMPTALICCVAIAIVVFASQALSDLAQLADIMVGKSARQLELALTAQSIFNSAAVAEKNAILSEDADKARGYIKGYDTASSDTIKTLDALRPLVTTAEKASLVDQFRKAVQDRAENSARVFELALAGKRDEANKLSGTTSAALRQTAIAASNKLNDLARKDLQDDREEAARTARRAERLLIAGSATGLIIAFGLMGWIALRQVIAPVRVMVQSMRRLVDGDVDFTPMHWQARDEIGEMASALESFRLNAREVRRLQNEKAQEQERFAQAKKSEMERLVRLFESSVQGAVDNVIEVAGTIEATSAATANHQQTGSKRSLTVADSAIATMSRLSDLSGAVEQMSVSIAEIARGVAEAATASGDAVKDTEGVGREINELARSANEIGTVVALISEIASQTNLLALNATIEAARAGEAGKGFAVVASEVKSLASQTARATIEITQQIEGIQGRARGAVSAVERVRSTIDRLSQMSASVATAVEEQSAVTGDIARNVTEVTADMNQVTGSVGDITHG